MNDIVCYNSDVRYVHAKESSSAVASVSANFDSFVRFDDYCDIVFYNGGVSQVNANTFSSRRVA